MSQLTLVEMESVLAIKVRTGELNIAGLEVARRRLRADISRGRVVVGPKIDERHYQGARRLLVRYGTTMALRTLDALQLAMAMELLVGGDISVLVAADHQLCAVAEVCGCATINPGSTIEVNAEECHLKLNY